MTRCSENRFKLVSARVPLNMSPKILKGREGVKDIPLPQALQPVHSKFRTRKQFQID
jgi:hypothetical protein